MQEHTRGDTQQDTKSICITHPHLLIRIHAVSKEYIPHYASEGAAGADIRACIPEPRILNPREIALIPTGLKVEIPRGYEIQVRPRSGLALHHGISLVNTPGTIDSDYRGEIQVILINHSDTPFTITNEMRIAQIVVARVERAEFSLEEKNVLTDSQRGERGFGHTGLQ